MIHHAPKAATIMLDDFFLQEPKVLQPNRNPLAIQAVIDGQTGMNTILADTCEWSFPGNTQPLWQRDLTTPLGESPLDHLLHLLPTFPWPSDFQTSSTSCCQRRSRRVYQFCKVRVEQL